MVEEINQWILGRPMTVSKTGSQSVSTTISIATQQKNVGRRRKNKLENASNAIKKGTL